MGGAWEGRDVTDIYLRPSLPYRLRTNTCDISDPDLALNQKTNGVRAGPCATWELNDVIVASDVTHSRKMLQGGAAAAAAGGGGGGGAAAAAAAGGFNGHPPVEAYPYAV